MERGRHYCRGTGNGMLLWWLSFWLLEVENKNSRLVRRRKIWGKETTEKMKVGINGG